MDSEPTQQDDSVTKIEDAVEHEQLAPKVEKPTPDGAVMDLQKQLNLEPTTIVLAKVKGYRAWPAMVLDETILPENIRKMKPKSIRLARKPTKPVIVVPVRFFSDDTYIWIKSCDLKVLASEEIEAFLLKRAKAKKHDTLIDAYRLAQNPPDMVEFNTWGSHGPPQYVDSPEEDSESEQPKKKILKLSIKLKKPPSKTPKMPSKPSSKGSSKSAFMGKSENGFDRFDRVDYQMESVEKSEEELVESDSQEGFDSDWGLEDTPYDIDSGDYIFEDEHDQKDFVESFPRAADLAHSLETFQYIFKDLHRILSPLLLSEDVEDEQKIVTKLRELERLLARADTPIVAFTKSPLFRVLLLTVHKPDFPDSTIHGAVQRIFNQINLQACEITEEDMVLKTKDNTPLPSESKSDEKMEEPSDAKSDDIEEKEVGGEITNEEAMVVG